VEGRRRHRKTGALAVLVTRSQFSSRAARAMHMHNFADYSHETDTVYLC